MFDKDRIFWTSDPHYFHNNIIFLAKRPFKDLNEMHDTLIRNWNKVVPIDGTVIINGDFAFTGNNDNIKSILDQLNGEKILVYGNHCIQNKFERDSIRKLFRYNTHYLNECKVKDEDAVNGVQNIFNVHYPCVSWPGKAQDSWHTFGHVHTSPYSEHSRDSKDMKIYATLKLKSYDVGVDNNNFTPVSYFQLKNRFNNL